MAYTLEAIIARPSVLEKASFGFADSKIVLLTSEAAIFPVTQAFYDRFLQTSPREAFSDCFHYLSYPLAAICSSLSEFGAVAYVEAEFFGGMGQQAAVVWEDQQVVLGPLEDADAINKALRLLGIKRGRGGDEFDAVDLGKHRETTEWLLEGS